MVYHVSTVHIFEIIFTNLILVHWIQQNSDHHLFHKMYRFEFCKTSFYQSRCIPSVVHGNFLKNNSVHLLLLSNSTHSNINKQFIWNSLPSWSSPVYSLLQGPLLLWEPNTEKSLELKSPTPLTSYISFNLIGRFMSIIISVIFDQSPYSDTVKKYTKAWIQCETLFVQLPL